MLKLRSIRTTAGLLAAMLGLTVVAVALHGYGLPPTRLQSPSEQLSFLVGWGEVFGVLFAGLLGATFFTGEVRHGTIRPTLLVAPRRGRVVAAKCVAVSVAGLLFGLAATSAAAATGRAALAARGLDAVLDGGDYALLMAGGVAAAAVWAVIGLGIGATVRSHVPTLVGLVTWLLFVEGALVDNLPSVGRFAPGALGQSLSGLHPDRLLAPATGGFLLVLYAIGAVAVGTLATTRRDFE